MSGHSKWHSIKHKKAAVDAKRGKVFTKLIREITVAARLGGGDTETNPRLRLAIAVAKGSNMPGDNIKRAIQKGTGELPGMIIEEVTYEGYGPGGVAILIEAMTDNKNRTVAEVRHVFSKAGGEMGRANTVAWQFERRGILEVAATSTDEDSLFEVVVEAGAEEIVPDGDVFRVETSVADFESVREAIEGSESVIEMAEISQIPQSTIKLEGKQAEQMLRLMEKLEDLDDIQNVWANFDIDDSLIEAMS